jgi:WhiB family redox-sensing transcriptional regulator
MPSTSPLTAHPATRRERRREWLPVGRHAPVGLPCQSHDPDLWFADQPVHLERAKMLCFDCPVRVACLLGALDRGEPTGVWGGQIFDQGRIVSHKRSRGRPRRGSAPPVTYPVNAITAGTDDRHALHRATSPGESRTTFAPHADGSGYAWSKEYRPDAQAPWQPVVRGPFS